MGQVAVPTTPGADTVLSMTGTVVSSSKNTVTVRSDSGRYIVYVFDRFTKKPATLSAGNKVVVVSEPTGEVGVRLATDILPYTPHAADEPSAATEAKPQPESAAPSATSPSTGSAARSTHPYDTGEAVPVSVRKLEGDIERQSRKYSFGFRAGVGLDPEVFLVGVQGRIGPFFSRNFSIRPNVDFGFGEVTKMFVFDLNGIYRLPFNTRGSKWGVFAGAGPAFQLLHRNFEEAASGKSIDFGDFKYQTGLNILAGVEFRSGFFLEAKSTVWAGPHLRLMFGYTF